MTGVPVLPIAIYTWNSACSYIHIESHKKAVSYFPG